MKYSVLTIYKRDNLCIMDSPVYTKELKERIPVYLEHIGFEKLIQLLVRHTRNPIIDSVVSVKDMQIDDTLSFEEFFKKNTDFLDRVQKLLVNYFIDAKDFLNTFLSKLASSVNPQQNKTVRKLVLERLTHEYHEHILQFDESVDIVLAQLVLVLKPRLFFPNLFKSVKESIFEKTNHDYSHIGLIDALLEDPDYIKVLKLFSKKYLEYSENSVLLKYRDELRLFLLDNMIIYSNTLIFHKGE